MFSILTALFLIVNGCGGSSAQVLLDQNLLRTNYPDYATVVNMTFRSLSIIHVDHFAFAGTIALQSLDLSNNSLTVISQAFNQYLFTMVTNSGTWAPPTHFNQLSTLNLSKNKIFHIDADSFVGAFCETLDLSFNSLTSVRSNQLFTKFTSYPNPIKLKTLKLNNNKLKDISGLFSYSNTVYPQLTTLRLEFNLLQTIDNNTFTNAKSLTHLYLNDNLITFIDPYAFKDLLNLRQLFLYNNNNTNVSPTNLQSLLMAMQVCKPAGQYCMVCLSESCTKTHQDFDEEYFINQLTPLNQIE